MNPGGFQSTRFRQSGRLTSFPSGAQWAAALAGDPYFANVSALLHLDGTNGSTSIVDVKGKTFTANGGAAITTSQSKFGGAAGDVNGSGKYITSAGHADFGFGSGDFTIEGWNWYSAGSANQCIFDNRSASNTGIGIYVASPGGGYLFVNSNVGNIVTSSVAFSATTWQHWAVTRESGTMRIFVDGTLVGSATDSRTYAAAPAIYLGDNYLVPGGASQPALAVLDDFRITKGVARYTANFTPPAAAFLDF